MDIETLRLDDLNIGGLKLYQDPCGFCFGTDAVLLAWFCRRKKFVRPVDLCTGNGVIPVLLSLGKYEKIIGVELLKENADIARLSVEYNGLGDRIEIINGDVRNINYKSPKENLSLKQNYFDMVSVNPPYSLSGSGFSASGRRGVARTELECSLTDVVSSASFLLKNGGRLCMVHRPERLSDILCVMCENSIEPKILITVSPRVGQKPELILIEGKKGANPGMIIEPSLFIYGPDGKYTTEFNAVYGR